VFLACACTTSRRRRRAGRNPYYGTGWAAGNYRTNQYNQNQYPQAPPQENNYYAHNQPQQQQPPYYARDDQTTGIEMPQRTYAPPEGPPKKV